MKSEVTKEHRRLKSSAGDVVSPPIIIGCTLTLLRQISFSGCKDAQKSSDVTRGGLAEGAMSGAFIKCLGALLAKFHSQGLGELSPWQKRIRNSLTRSC